LTRFSSQPPRRPRTAAARDALDARQAIDEEFRCQVLDPTPSKKPGHPARFGRAEVNRNSEVGHGRPVASDSRRGLGT